MADKRFVCIGDFEKYAATHLPSVSRVFTNHGADDEVTMRDNVEAFRRWRLRPRVLVDVSKRTTKTTVLGHAIDFPVCVAPTGFQRLAHPDGEVAVAKAAADMNTIYVMSSGATSSIEEVTAEAPNGVKWLQLYIPQDRRLTEQMIRRAEKAGFSALVFTVDLPQLGKRRESCRNPFEIPPHLKLGNFGDSIDKGLNDDLQGYGVPTAKGEQFQDNLTWKDIDWLRSFSKLPIMAKGIMTAEDAELAVEHGVSAIFVSNHGGRQLDGCLATIDVLPEIVQAVKGRVEIYLDGGVRTGTDVLKAIALGAKAVFLGRPIVWGLSYNGYEGVRKVLSIMKEEFNLALALIGSTGPANIRPSLVVRDCRCSRL
ncbi:2-Hydroxyacid oxidase 1-like [Lineus longissimus]|uniref:2-Hydroxyacid oxidase 1-like n=1 Tax=Lineus longissimus TaxID=88925 RepID=UPI002B4F344B